MAAVHRWRRNVEGAHRVKPVTPAFGFQPKPRASDCYGLLGSDGFIITMPPLYSYRCKKCHSSTDAFRKVDDRDNAPTCECGGKTRKIISLYRVHPDMAPYYDDNLQTHIKGKQHRRKVMKEQGVEELIGKGWRH